MEWERSIGRYESRLGIYDGITILNVGDTAVSCKVFDGPTWDKPNEFSPRGPFPENLRCAAVCRMPGHGYYTSWCCNGRPIICNCLKKSELAPGSAWFEEQAGLCVIEYEQRNWLFLTCPANDTPGDPAVSRPPGIPLLADGTDDCNVLCKKSDNYKNYLGCVLNINCALAPGGALGRLLCEEERCAAQKFAECSRRAYDTACAATTGRQCDQVGQQELDQIYNTLAVTSGNCSVNKYQECR